MASVSVIIPVYNGAHSIGPCLESLLNQTFPATSIIVVDNCSTDATAEVVQRYPVLLLHCAQRGPAATRNVGIAASTADLVAFTDADCMAAPDWLARLVAPFDDPDVIGVGGDIQFYRNHTPSPIELFSEARPPLVNFVSGPGEFLPHLYTANAAYRRSVVAAVGGFNEHMLTGEDVDLAWRTQMHTGLKVAYVPEAVIFHRHRYSFRGLFKQYRQYGFGEIMLDTLYQHVPGYPRTLRFQMRRIAGQVRALPRYVVSLAVRRVRHMRGTASATEALHPWLCLLIESSNVLGKLQALAVTRGMRRINAPSQQEAARYIQHFY